MLFVGIDDTDMPDTPGTNQLARAIADRLAPACRCLLIVRHQLSPDPRVPCTSKNGSASIRLAADGDCDPSFIAAEARAVMRAAFVPGSDPGLCVAAAVPAEVTAWGRRCQREVVTQAEARDIAARHGLHLEGLGGTEGGVIGALAAVGLAAAGDDGRVVRLGDWPDDLTGVRDIAEVAARGVGVRVIGTGEAVTDGRVDLGKKLRPNCRAGGVVLFVEPGEGAWRAVRVT